MPKISLPVQEMENRFIRPVVMEVTRDLMKITGITNSTEIYYPSDLERTAQIGSTMTEDIQPNLTASMQRMWIEVTENYIDDSLGSVAVNYPDAPFVFLDQCLPVALKPVYVKAEYTLAFKYRAIDRTAALRWRDDIVTKMAAMREQFRHNPTFGYDIPNEFIVVLQEIYRLREANDGYGDTYQAWFDSCKTSRLTQLTTQIGTQPVWSVGETAERVLGMFDFAGKPEEGSKEGDNPTWTISFTYKFQLDKPIEMHMAYPVTIHQQVIKYIGYRPPKDKFNMVGSTLSMRSQRYFESSYMVDRSIRNQGLSIPEFDEFEADQVMPNTIRIVELLVGVDDTGVLCSLADMENFTFSPAVTQFLMSEAQYMVNPLRSLFCVSLYRGNDLVQAPALVIQPNLDVTLVNPQSKRLVYHVRLDLYVDWTRIDPAAITRARQNAAALTEILKLLDPTLAERGLIPQPIKGTTVLPKGPISGIIDGIHKGIRGGNNQVYQFNTVGTFFIVAKKAAQYVTP